MEVWRRSGGYSMSKQATTAREVSVFDDSEILEYAEAKVKMGGNICKAAVQLLYTEEKVAAEERVQMSRCKKSLENIPRSYPTRRLVQRVSRP